MENYGFVTEKDGVQYYRALDIKTKPFEVKVVDGKIIKCKIKEELWQHTK